MIKKYIPIVFMGLGLMGLTTGCDTMNTEPFESYSEDLVWSTPETAEAFVIDTYNNAFSQYQATSARWESRTPNGVMCDQVENTICGFATEVGLDAYSNEGEFGRFGEQRRCNLIMEKVAASNLPEGKKAQLIAEAHLLRAMLYFDMTRKMGRFVPITKVLTPEDKEEFNTPLTANVAASYKLVMADFNEALKPGALPETSSKSRINVYTAHALRSRAALQAYAYTKEASYLDIAIESANKVINSGNYELTADYGSIFNNEAPQDPEIIMGKYYLDSDCQIGWFDEMIRVLPNLSEDESKKGSADGVATLLPRKTFNGWGIFFPSQDLVDQYLVIDEKTNEAKVWYESSQIVDNVEFLPTEGLTPGCVEKFKRNDNEYRNMPSVIDLKTGKEMDDYPNVKFNLKVKDGVDRNITQLMYGNRDKRMDGTIVRDDTDWIGEHIGIQMGGSASQGVRSKEDGGWYTTTTGYYWRKYIVPSLPQMAAWSFIDCHFVIARLGEMYMNLAEAYLLKGEVAKAVAALNETRVKHGGLPASKAATKEEAWKDYMRERRVEMAYEEGDIYFSYLRWGKYGGLANHGRPAGDVIKDLDTPVYKINITSDRKGALVNRLNLLDSWNRNFSIKRYLLPIPQSQIDKRAAAGIIDEQNPNW